MFIHTSSGSIVLESFNNLKLIKLNMKVFVVVALALLVTVKAADPPTAATTDKNVKCTTMP